MATAAAAAAATTTTTTTTTTIETLTPAKRTAKLVCFSFAAYAKNLINHLKSLNIPIHPGINDAEFADIESTFGFTFPPDLRSILREGLPVGPAFPNWRSSSPQQLHILLNLPVLSLLKNISLNKFWSDSWGKKPQDESRALSLVKQLLDKTPTLVPIYRNCYVPSSPNMAGNPVFYIDSEEVRILSFDLAGFFKDVESLHASSGFYKPLVRGSMSFHTPAWAAKEARRIEFWTDAAERGRRLVARVDTLGWWSGAEIGVGLGLGLESCLEDVFWRLRDGGWEEEEVREMMMMMDGCDHRNSEKGGVQSVRDYRGCVAWHVRVLATVLLRAGWSREDVVYSLGVQDYESVIGVDSLEGNSAGYLEFQQPINCCKEKVDDRKSTIEQLMHVHALQVLR